MKQMEEPLNRFVPVKVIIKHMILAQKKLMEENRRLRVDLNLANVDKHRLGKTIESLNTVISELRGNHKDWTREIHAEDLYRNQQIRLAQMKADREKMRNRRDELIAKCKQYEDLLREHGLLPEFQK